MSTGGKHDVVIWSAFPLYHIPAIDRSRPASNGYIFVSIDRVSVAAIKSYSFVLCSRRGRTAGTRQHTIDGIEQATTMNHH